jgi:hypothetical protein
MVTAERRGALRPTPQNAARAPLEWRRGMSGAEALILRVAAQRLAILRPDPEGEACLRINEDKGAVRRIEKG